MNCRGLAWRGSWLRASAQTSHRGGRGGREAEGDPAPAFCAGNEAAYNEPRRKIFTHFVNRSRCCVMSKFSGVVLRVFSPFLAVFVLLWRVVLLCVVVPSVSLARCLFGRRVGGALERYRIDKKGKKFK